MSTPPVFNSKRKSYEMKKTWFQSSSEHPSADLQTSRKTSFRQPARAAFVNDIVNEEFKGAESKQFVRRHTKANNKKGKNPK